MSLRCQSHLIMHPYIFGFRASLNSELDVQFLLGYYFKVFSRPNFLTFQHFLTLEIHDNFVCVCRNAIPQKFHQMLWAVKHGLKSDGRNEELKEIIEADCVKISRIKKI